MDSLKLISAMIDRDVILMHDALEPGMLMSNETCRRIGDHAKLLLAIAKDQSESVGPELAKLTMDELRTLAAEAVQVVGLQSHETYTKEADDVYDPPNAAL